MSACRRYRKRAEKAVVAVQLDLDTDGFVYRKWGGEQTCKPGDWLVDNNGDIYTVDKDTFSRTYEKAGPGVFRKITPVWAKVAARSGSVDTKEGKSKYKVGDYLVFNNEDGADAYCMTKKKFEDMYELDD